MESVLGRAVALLEAFAADDHELSLAELVRRTRLPKSTVHRMLGELVSLRLLERVGTGYRLGSRLFELGMRAGVERGLMEVAIPFMEDLYERTHETVHLGVREGTEVVYVAKIGGHRQAAAPSRVGGRMPLHCTAIGKALLAFGPGQCSTRRSPPASPVVRREPSLPPGCCARSWRRVGSGRQLRARGVEHRHRLRGRTGLDADEQAIAAVSVTGPVTRFRPESAAAAVRAAGAGIAATWARRPTQRDAGPPPVPRVPGQ